MLVIRLQRTGRSGYAHYRIVVQDSRKAPTSGKIVKHLGHYNPHTKEVVLNKDLAEFYLKNGAQPSNRVIGILQAEGIALPAWASKDAPKKRSIRNPEKLRKNQPKEEPKAEEKAEKPQDDVAEVAEQAAPVEEAPAEASEAVAEKSE